ncbi:3-oxoacyl-[acyl-carrier protein] reductase [Pseudomonas sp. Tn43]|uniref:SDR family NAD(P)-dependent oxidoreductase n=1 Tax=unclassified Pseudomonas TaxID=196821 RepID=UPI000BABFD12|nr:MULTISPECIES: SDR family oxidoreductase [unclassified Pseudomonas]MBB3239735.1 3-oxoacyl-[acyl-carrier protein] reductase [Pseudomonas sp. Tn43]PAU61485.1 3-oxoacyl-ACP reductase [Pseudomonas sp. PICF141]
MNLGLEGKTALVSASTAGIGLAIATQLLEDGARVIINGRSEAGVAQRVSELNKRFGEGRALPLVADVSKAGGEAAAAAAYPQIDILINNMGTYELSDFFSTSDEDWQRMFETNVWSGVRLARTYMKGMLERGHGRVIFISSEVALTPMASMAHYSASKATQLSISRSLAELTKGTSVTVNAVLPGPTETESLKGFIESVNPGLTYADAEKKFMTENRPSSLIFRLAKPAEVANVVAFLSSERAAVINGAAIRAEGGTVQTIA